ncbi:MAG: DUF4919 domain-containing protein [Microscillaceae bacterium]|nr:DUF4919 domain-containing protein [Microscillaceae bacterium]MDW8461174.1 DUF4919 domain-containing protein [Cytophagales bacterium]
MCPNFFKYFSCLTFLLLSPLLIRGQTIAGYQVAGYTYSDIADEVNDPQSPFYYPKLLQKYYNDTARLTKKEILFLYYGFAARPEYNPYRHRILEDSLYRLIDKQLLYKAEVLADSLLHLNPLSMFGNVAKGVITSMRLDTLNTQKHIRRYQIVLDAIFTSGEGRSYENAMHVISPKDAEAVLYRFNLKSLSKSFNGYQGNYYDVHIARSEDGRREFPVYFNVTLPYKIGLPKR